MMRLRAGVLAGAVLVATVVWGGPAAAAEAGEQMRSPTASLTITKAAEALDGSGGTVFEFGGSLGSFRLADGESVTFAGLAPGSYTVAESLPQGWRFGGVTCLGVEPQVSAGTASMTVTLQMGQPAACTFHNYQEQVAGPSASLTIVERTAPAGGSGFRFDAGALGTFTLADGGSTVFGELDAGTYTVTQDDPGGAWALRSVQCTGGDYRVAGPSLTVDLAVGEVAVCTFINGTGDLPVTGASMPLPWLLVAGAAALLVGAGMVRAARPRRVRS